MLVCIVFLVQRKSSKYTSLRLLSWGMVVWETWTRHAIIIHNISTSWHSFLNIIITMCKYETLIWKKGPLLSKHLWPDFLKKTTVKTYQKTVLYTYSIVSNCLYTKLFLRCFNSVFLQKSGYKCFDRSGLFCKSGHIFYNFTWYRCHYLVSCLGSNDHIGFKSHN